MKRVLQTTCLMASAAGLLAGSVGCRHTIAVEPIEVKPIYMTLDINLKVDHELDQFYDFEKPAPSGATTAPASPSSATPAQPPHPDSGGVEGGSR